MTEFSTWEWIRASGWSAYFLLFISICFGMMQKMGFISKSIGRYLLIAHQTAGWFAFLLAFFHGFLLYFDDYQPFSILEIFIPFQSKYQPIFTGLGIISFYSMFLIFLSTDLLKQVGRNVWKIIHLLILPSFILASLHGFFIGSDTDETWSKIVYASAIFVFLLLNFFRFFAKLKKMFKNY